jgi:hypothetical protein
MPVSKDEWTLTPEASLLASILKLMGRDEKTQKAAADYRQVKGMTADPAVIHKAEQALRDLGEE